MQENKDLIFLPDPVAQFHDWFSLAEAREVNDPSAMSLATVGSDGAPNVRILLNRGMDARGFRFMTNSESQKGDEIAANPRAAICFHWKSLRCQVRAQGIVASVPPAESDAYFAARPRKSQIGAWASRQSRPLESLAELDTRFAEFEAKFSGGPVPRPTYWHGYILSPDWIEFWAERPHRLHERMLYAREGNGWRQTRLYP